MSLNSLSFNAHCPDSYLTIKPIYAIHNIHNSLTNRNYKS